jgi:hypothetical protein
MGARLEIVVTGQKRQRVRAKGGPMTGSAKQSILSLRGEMDCFASLAMTLL